MTKKKLLIKNALLVDPKNEMEFIGSLLVEKGIIKEIFNKPSPNYDISDCKIIDCKKNVLSPGLIDMWVFSGEPGYEYKENFRTLSNAALSGGVTSVVTMPNTDPIIDNVSIVDFLKRRGRDKSKINIYPCASLTKN